MSPSSTKKVYLRFLKVNLKSKIQWKLRLKVVFSEKSHYSEKSVTSVLSCAANLIKRKFDRTEISSSCLFQHSVYLTRRKYENTGIWPHGLGRGGGGGLLSRRKPIKFQLDNQRLRSITGFSINEEIFVRSMIYTGTFKPYFAQTKRVQTLAP